MNCSLCGEVCRCPSGPLATALEQPDPGVEFAVVAGDQGQGAQNVQTKDVQVEDVQAKDAENQGAQPECASAWRDELSARLSHYRARRKVRPPRYPSLRLQFAKSDWSTHANATGESGPLPSFESVSNHALALDEMRQGPYAPATEVESPAAEAAPSLVHPVGHLDGHLSVTSPGHSSRHTAGAKIIEFPRFAWGPPPPPPDQLAEPVSERPRILEVPEVAPPPPALGGITIDAVEQQESEKRPGIDIPLQSAPLGRRVLAALVDGLIIATASALFGFIFWKIAAVRPPLIQEMGLAAGIPCLFWAAYQYLLIVYAASTPGLRVAGLELTRFNGTSTSRSLRRWRALASCLSALSLGMGYAWVFLDEDALCWHDRITHTYLAPRRSGNGSDTPPPIMRGKASE